MKKKLSLSLAALMLISSLSVNAYAYEPADFPITINNGPALEMLYGPVVENGTTLVPFRDVLEEMGANVDWDAETKTVTCTLGDKSVSLAIGSDVMTTDSGSVKLDVPAKIIDTKTYVPLRAISEGLGAQVDWNAQTKTINITTSDDIAETLSKKELGYGMQSYSTSIQSGSKDIMPVNTSYPIFRGSGRAISKINKYIADTAQGKVNTYKVANQKRLYSLYQQAIKDGTRDSFSSYSYNIDYEVKTAEDGIISLFVTETINSDTQNSVTCSGITFNSVTGNIITADELIENAADIVKAGFEAEGFSQKSIKALKLDDTSFYVDGNEMIYIINKGSLSNNLETYILTLPEREEYTTLPEATAITSENVTASDTLYAQEHGIVMRLNTTYPQFTGGGRENLKILNSVIAQAQEKAMADYKEENSTAALAAYKEFEATKDKKTDRFEPWLWTNKCEVKYNNNKIASVVVSTYIFKGDGTEATTYTAYTCDLSSGQIIDVDSLINDTAKTDSSARAAFKALIEKDRLNFYTNVYERFDLTKATKYISADGVTYMFNPGTLASVSKGVIEVTVPMS